MWSPCGEKVWWMASVLGLSALFLPASIGDLPGCDCPIFGTDQSTRLSRSTRDRVFLNFEAPSQCRGNVTAWSFCYYRSGDGDDLDDNFQYGARFVVYRRAGLTSATYIPVAGSITSMLLSYSDAIMGFRCLNETLSQSFQIQENDVIGACVWDEGPIRPLYLLGEGDNNNQNLYQYERARGCMDDQLISIDTSSGDFERRDLQLHLQASIVATDFCQAGSNPPATGPASGSTSGTLLDTNNAAMCSGNITSWHYCYYLSAAPAGQTHTMTVAAWRLEAGMYQLVSGTNRTVTLNPIETKAKIFCMEKALDPVDYVLVSEGDVIGVVLPSTNPIPVISSNAGSDSSLMVHSQTTGATDLLGSEFTLMPSSTLHVYAKLVTVEDTPTVQTVRGDMRSSPPSRPTATTSASTGTIKTVTDVPQNCSDGVGRQSSTSANITATVASNTSSCGDGVLLQPDTQPAMSLNDLVWVSIAAALLIMSIAVVSLAAYCYSSFFKPSDKISNGGFSNMGDSPFPSLQGPGGIEESLYDYPAIPIITTSIILQPDSSTSTDGACYSCVESGGPVEVAPSDAHCNISSTESGISSCSSSGTISNEAYASRMDMMENEAYSHDSNVRGAGLETALNEAYGSRMDVVENEAYSIVRGATLETAPNQAYGSRMDVVENAADSIVRGGAIEAALNDMVENKAYSRDFIAKKEIIETAQNPSYASCMDMVENEAYSHDSKNKRGTMQVYHSREENMKRNLNDTPPVN